MVPGEAPNPLMLMLCGCYVDAAGQPTYILFGKAHPTLWSGWCVDGVYGVARLPRRHTVPQLWTVLGMSLRKVTLLGSNLESATDLKRTETPHSLCCDFGGYKSFTTRWLGCRVQVWVQVWAPAGILAISPKAVPEGNRRFRGQNQRPSSWGSSPALLARVGRASTTQGVSESAAVAVGSDRLAWGKLAILTQFESQKGLKAL